MFSHLADTVDGDQLIFARSAEGHSHLVDNRSTKDRYKVGDEVAIAGILKVSAIQPNKDGTVSYSFDRGFSLHENMVNQMLLRPHEKPIPQEVAQNPLYSGKVVAISASPKAFSISLATNRIGRIFEIADGVLVGNRDDLYEKYGFACEYDSPVRSFGEFCNCHAMNDWIELKS